MRRGIARNKPVIWVKRKQKSFCKGGWTAKSLICPRANLLALSAALSKYGSSFRDAPLGAGPKSRSCINVQRVARVNEATRGDAAAANPDIASLIRVAFPQKHHGRNRPGHRGLRKLRLLTAP
jgi:hypothetical protein